MENPNEPQTMAPHSSKNALTAMLAVVVTALVFSVGFYFIQGSKSKTVDREIQQQIALLNEQVDKLKKENQELKTAKKEMHEKTAQAGSSIKLPVVVYGRSGLLNNTPQGLAEKKILEQKLIEPYIDYNNQDGTNLVAMYILVPQYTGGEYQITAIFGSEKQYGSEEFNFGKREQEYDYWKPECMGPCNFSEAFKAKYPQIAK